MNQAPVKKGQIVSKGEVIAKTGKTGKATTSQLYFIMGKGSGDNGKILEPEYIIKQ